MSFFGRAKAPGAEVGHAIDWSSDIGADASVNSSSWLIIGSNGAVVSSGLSANVTTVVVSGGILMKPIVVRNTVVTSDGQELTKSIKLAVDPA